MFQITLRFNVPTEYAGRLFWQLQYGSGFNRVEWRGGPEYVYDGIGDVIGQIPSVLTRFEIEFKPWLAVLDCMKELALIVGSTFIEAKERDSVVSKIKDSLEMSIDGIPDMVCTTWAFGVLMDELDEKENDNERGDEEGICLPAVRGGAGCGDAGGGAASGRG